MAESRIAKGLVDTSVVIGLDRIPTNQLIAATALAARLPLYTLNPGAFGGSDGLIDVVAVKVATPRDGEL